MQELDFIRQEMTHYGVAAQLLLRSGSGAEYEITVLPDGAVQIAAADNSGLLHGVYALAERCGWSFIQPGRDYCCPQLKRELPPGSRITASGELLARRGVFYDGRASGVLPEVVDWMGKNRMNILVCRRKGELAPEIVEMAQQRGILIADNVSLFAAANRCVNHTIDEQCCPVNRFWQEKILQNRAEKFMIYADYLESAGETPLIHFDELFCEAEFYFRSGAAGIVMPPEAGRYYWQWMNRFLLARSAAGEDKLETIDRMFTALFGKESFYARRFFAAVKDLQLSAGGCGSFNNGEWIAGVTEAEWEELAGYLDGMTPGSALRCCLSDMRQKKIKLCGLEPDL